MGMATLRVTVCYATYGRKGATPLEPPPVSPLRSLRDLPHRGNPAICPYPWRSGPRSPRADGRLGPPRRNSGRASSRSLLERHEVELPEFRLRSVQQGRSAVAHLLDPVISLRAGAGSVGAGGGCGGRRGQSAPPACGRSPP
jgi:hypothetical protein